MTTIATLAVEMEAKADQLQGTFDSTFRSLNLFDTKAASTQQALGNLQRAFDSWSKASSPADQMNNYNDLMRSITDARSEYERQALRERLEEEERVAEEAYQIQVDLADKEQDLVLMQQDMMVELARASTNAKLQEREREHMEIIRMAKEEYDLRVAQSDMGIELERVRVESAESYMNKEVSDALNLYDQRVALEERYYSLTHNELENALHEHDNYYAALMAKHEENAEMMALIDKNRELERARITEAGSGISGRAMLKVHQVAMLMNNTIGLSSGQMKALNMAMAVLGVRGNLLSGGLARIKKSLASFAATLASIGPIGWTAAAAVAAVTASVILAKGTESRIKELVQLRQSYGDLTLYVIDLMRAMYNPRPSSSALDKVKQDITELQGKQEQLVKPEGSFWDFLDQDNAYRVAMLAFDYANQSSLKLAKGLRETRNALEAIAKVQTEVNDARRMSNLQKTPEERGGLGSLQSQIEDEMRVAQAALEAFNYWDTQGKSAAVREEYIASLERMKALTEQLAARKKAVVDRIDDMKLSLQESEGLVDNIAASFARLKIPDATPEQMQQILNLMRQMEASQAWNKMHDNIKSVNDRLQDEINNMGVDARWAEYGKLQKQLESVAPENQEQYKQYLDLIKNNILLLEKLKGEEDAAAKNKEWLNGIMEEGKQVYEETRTPLEAYQKRVERLDVLLAQGAINADTYARAVAEAQKGLGGGTPLDMGTFQEVRTSLVDVKALSMTPTNDPVVGAIEDGNTALAKINTTLGRIEQKEGLA